tara:strand:- start:619 stop:906 length:288 start_codon:yes stop_codon:yes gene_type:complete
MSDTKDVEIRFTKDEMDSLRELQNEYTQKQNLLGQISVQALFMKQQIEELEAKKTQVEKEYMEIQQKEKQIVDDLNSKYGEGSLNPETGVFTPNK